MYSLLSVNASADAGVIADARYQWGLRRKNWYQVLAVIDKLCPNGVQSRRRERDYRSGTVNSKSFVGKVLLRIKRKFELTYAL